MAVSRFSVSIPTDLLEKLDAYVQTNATFKNRSDAIAKFVEHGLNNYPPAREVVCIDATADTVPQLIDYLNGIDGVKAVHTTS